MSDAYKGNASNEITNNKPKGKNKMQPIMPYLVIPEDRQDRIMARSGQIIGFSASRVVWSFGFMPASDAGKAYGVYTDNFTFVIADYNGKILDTFNGFGFELPIRFKNIIDKK